MTRHPVGGPSARGGPGIVKRWAAPAMPHLLAARADLQVVLYYVLQDDLPLGGDLGGWNLVIGMGLIGVGSIFATQWE